MGQIRSRISPVGTVHSAKITELVDKGATVDFNEHIVAFVPTRHLEKEDW